ncbi:amino acid ABC transporter substrate-binding protein [uncultured Desulfosarcina sp.]|uniref:amino acid ABC transporter substrate-binding protein n=1 Tax=uncultured Desulfosarcina sp. TaxID=218289 RepID=UPI0029C88DCE|nr:amino acid ABC transporter substrate-binding protein [uncultured Desulfosarcina sp.]
MHRYPSAGRVLALTILILFLPLAGYGELPKPIRIGATVSLSGNFSEPSAMVRDGYRLWEKQVNQHGGLIGRPVELVVYDDRSDPETVYDLYQRLIHQDRVDLVLSPYGTPLTLQASQVSEASQMIMLACAASGKAIWNRVYRYVFGMYALADRYFIGMLDLMARQGHDTVSIIYEDSPFNIDVANGAEKWARRFGIAVALKESFAPGQGQLGGLLQDAIEKNAAGLILSAYPPEGYRMLELMQAAGWRPRAIGMTIAPIHPDFYLKAGPIAEGIFGPSQWEPDERIPFPGTTKFIRDFQAAYHKLPSYHAGSAYAGCQILERAITELNEINQDRIRDYISSLDTVTVIGRFKVDHQGRQVGHNPILVQWQDGKKEIVYPTKMQTAQPRF